MAMSDGYRNAVADAGGELITHIGLVDGEGTEITGGSPAYARKAVTWLDAADGVIRPNADIVFDVPAGATVAGWRGFSADTEGTDYGGAALTPAAFTLQGHYTLSAASTGISHANPA